MGDDTPDAQTFAPDSTTLNTGSQEFTRPDQEVPGRKLQQQAAVPAAHLHAQLRPGSSVLGAGAYVKWIRPTPTSERFRAGAFQAYGKLFVPGFVLRAKATWGNDLADHSMLGGFVTTGSGPDAEFQPTNVLATWIDVETIGQRFSFGLFGGYTTQLGVGEEVMPTSFNARALNARALGPSAPSIDYLWRVSPRVKLNEGPLRFALEVEATSALYTSTLDDELAPQSTDSDDPIINVRSNFTVTYFF